MSTSVDDTSHEYLNIIGARLKGIKILKGITQQQAAEDTGITQSFLSAVERGKKSACTLQIISLIKYYNVSYETIFGEHKGSYCFEDFSNDRKLVGCVGLLKEFIAEYPSLEIGAENYLKICIYMLLRSIYSENPHNSQKIFSIDYDIAMIESQKVIKNTPENLSRFIRQSRKINPDVLEIPVHHSGELRKFVYECEQMLAVNELNLSRKIFSTIAAGAMAADIEGKLSSGTPYGINLQTGAIGYTSVTVVSLKLKKSGINSANSAASDWRSQKRNASYDMEYYRRKMYEEE